MKRGAWLGIGVCLCCGLIACGSDSDGGGNSGSVGSFSTGLSPGQELGGLSEAEVAQLCAALEDAAEQMVASPEFHEGNCKLSGMIMTAMLAMAGTPSDAELQQACSEVYDQCVAADPQPGEESGQCNAPPADCTATVQEYEACMEASMQAMRDAYAQLPGCSQLTAETLQSSGQPTASEPPAACRPVVDKCPALDVSAPGSSSESFD